MKFRSGRTSAFWLLDFFLSCRKLRQFFSLLTGIWMALLDGSTTWRTEEASRQERSTDHGRIPVWSVDVWTPMTGAQAVRQAYQTSLLLDSENSTDVVIFRHFRREKFWILDIPRYESIRFAFTTLRTGLPEKETALRSCPFHFHAPLFFISLLCNVVPSEQGTVVTALMQSIKAKEMLPQAQAESWLCLGEVD